MHFPFLIQIVEESKFEKFWDQVKAETVDTLLLLMRVSCDTRYSALDLERFDM